MKRTFAFFAIAVGCALATPRAEAQDPLPPDVQAIGNSNAGKNASASDLVLPPLKTAQKEYQEAAQRATSVALEFLQQASQKSPDALANDRQAVRDKLRPLVEQSFDARQRLQQAELNELRARLAEIEQAIAQREQRKDAVVDSRIDELLNPSAGRAGGGFIYETVVKDGREVSIARWIGPGKNPAAPSAPVPTPPYHVEQAGTAPSAAPAPPVNLPPGTEVRLRYPQVEEVLPNGERKMVTRPVYETVRTAQSAAPQDNGESSDATLALPGKSDEQSTGGKGAATAEGGFDIETRERLAKLDLEAAEKEFQAAEEKMRYTRKLQEKGLLSQSDFREREKEFRQAEYELKRAKLKLAGLARDREGLQFDAEADILQAQLEFKRAEAKVDAAKAAAAAADAEIQKLESDVEAAKANYEFREKVYKRLQELARQGTIDNKVLDEKEAEFEAARPAFAAAEAALQKGSASVGQAKAGIAEAVAEQDLARERLRAAKARRERLVTPKHPPEQPKAGANDPAAPKSELDAAT